MKFSEVLKNCDIHRVEWEQACFVNDAKARVIAWGKFMEFVSMAKDAPLK